MAGKKYTFYASAKTALFLESIPASERNSIINVALEVWKAAADRRYLQALKIQKEIRDNSKQLGFQ